MGRIKRGGYIFEFWVGDHPPRHVHVFKNGRFVAKIELDENLTLMAGRGRKKLMKVIRQLIKEGMIQ